MRRRLGAMLAFGAVSFGCFGRPPLASIDEQLDLVAVALHEGRFEDAEEVVASARERDRRHVDAARWSSVLADMAWDDEKAIREQMVAIHSARRLELQDELPELRGRLGDLLFQAGRWGESTMPLLAGATGDGAATTRRRAFAILSGALPFSRRFSGPLLTEQPLLVGLTPEFVCGTHGRLRPFAIDTGTSMTTVAADFAAELGVRSLQPAGMIHDAAGRELPVRVGLMPRFRIGDVEIGTVPVLVISDRALELRDLHGGPERTPRGVLGLDLLSACRLIVDPERGSVVIELSQGLQEAGAVRCLRYEGRCLVPVVIEGRRYWFVLDTGASHSSLSRRGLRDLPGGSGRAMPTFRRVRTVGGSVVAVQEVRDLVLRCSDARFLQVTLPVVDRGSDGAFPVHGVLGIDLLQRCRLTLDQGRFRLSALR